MKAICPVCGKEFDDANEHGVRPKRFCSPRCRGIYHCRASKARKRGAEVGPDGHPLRPGRKCSVCGKEIDPRKVEGTVCCSDACSQKRSNRLRLGNPVGEAEYRAFCEKRNVAKAEKAAKRLPKVCAYCGASFTPVRRDAVYCSKKCGDADYHRRNRETLREKERAYRATHPRPGRNVSASKARKATPNLTFVQKREIPERASIGRVEAYLSLPAAERWARRDTLTKKELTMAQAMWMRMKCAPAVYNYPRAVAK